MATATKPRSTRSAKPATVADTLTPEQVESARITARLTELKAAYVAARTGETKHKGILDDAKLQWENTRVITSRVAYAVAMLKPLADGSPNLSFAARALHFKEEDYALTGDALKSKTKSAKSSIRNYVAAGAALQEAGHCPMGEEDKGNPAEPTKEERKVVADAFRAGNKRAPGAPASTKDTGNGGGDTGGDTGGDSNTPPNTDALTFADLNGHLGRMDATLKALIADGAEITKEQAEHALAALGTLAMTLSEYVGMDADGE